MQNIFGVKKVWPSKVELYLEVNAWTQISNKVCIQKMAKGA